MNIHERKGSADLNIKVEVYHCVLIRAGMLIRLNMVKCVFMNWDLESRSINLMIEFVALFIKF